MKDNMHCVLVDNDEDDRELFCMALEEVSPDISCTTFGSAGQALEKLAEDPTFIPRYIFIDMNMPMINGKECLAGIRKLEHLQQVPVFMYSTACDPRSIQQVKEMGAIDLLVKPDSYPGLVQLLAKVLQTTAVS